MTTWTSDELNKIGKADELEIASLRQDGTLRKLVIIWVVRIGNDLYVRSVNGRTSGWFRGVLERHEGFIQAGGVSKDVTFVEETDLAIIAQVDAVYRTKYLSAGAQYVDPMLEPGAREATVKLVPRESNLIP